jgi:iron complex outermembrane receptor protein
MTITGKLNNNFERRPFNNLADRTLSGGFRYTVNYKTAKIDFVTGVELIREQYIWKLDKDTVLLNKNMEVRDQFNIFSVFNYRPVPSLTLSFAGAVNLVSYKLKDLFSQNGDQSGSRTFPVIFSPRLGINYAPGRIFAFYASAGHGFSMPSPEETLLPQGNVNSEIRPEQGFQYETGIRVSKGKTLAVDAAIYLIELRDLLVTKRITEDIFTGINAGKTHHHGFELQFRTPFFDNGKFPGSMIFYLSYTYSSNRFVSFNDAGIIYDGKYLPGIPVHDLSLRFEWKTFNRFEILPSVHYTGNQFLNDENSLRYNGFLLINIKTIMNFGIFKDDDLSLFLTINNLTNSKYASMLIVNAIGFNNAEPRYYYPGLPLNASAGVRFNF